MNSKGASGCSQQVSDDELIGGHGGARCRADASPTRSAQSTDRVNPEVPGWTKRSESNPSLLEKLYCIHFRFRQNVL